MGTITIIKRGINIVMIYMSSSQVLHEMLELWPSCKMVNGKARHSQSQGSVERCNRDVEAMLACWRHDNGRKIGLGASRRSSTPSFPAFTPE